MDLEEQITESLIQNWVPDEEHNTESLDDTNSYLKLLESNTGLKVIQHSKVLKVFRESGKLGLFITISFTKKTNEHSIIFKKVVSH